MAKKKLKEKVNKTKKAIKDNAKGDIKSKKNKEEGSTEIKSLAAFYAKHLKGVEDDLSLVSNSMIEAERVSSGSLCIDWIFGGGFVPGMSSVSGEEQTGKTTVGYHTLAQAHGVLHLPYTGLYDAEGAVSPKYTGRIWEPFGMDVKHLISKAGREDGFYYFRDQVIEKMFDYLKQTMAKMPDKNWNSTIGSWCYQFPKRDEYFKTLMQFMGVKPDQKASAGGNFYICPTDYSGPEGFFMADSFAALLTREEENKEETGDSHQNAKEASAFSKHLKRVKVDLAEKKIVMLGTNQLGSHVRKVYGHPDDQLYEKGGNALKYYSEARGRFFSRAGSAAAKLGPFTADKDNSKFVIEDSVEYEGGKDRYALKEAKNTKNKFGPPGLKTFIRVWVSDGKGKPRGIDPVFDVFHHLTNTGQLIKVKGNIQFKLKDSVGKKRAGKLNALPPFKFSSLKTLVIAEYIGSSELLRKAMKQLGADFKPNLRESLFKQLKSDDSVYSTIKERNKTEDELMEDDDADYEAL